MSDQHPNPADRRSAIDWARRVLNSSGKYVILDTETTGLGKTDEIIQLAVIDLNGNTLFDENLRPTKRKRMSAKAVEIHGLTMASLKDCPTFAELTRPLKKAIGRRRIITYNAEFDKRLYKQTWELAGGFLPRAEWECAMLQYAKYVGQWNHYHQDYKWQKLKGGDHSALGDCLATLNLVSAMAATMKPKKWYEIWISQ